MISMTDALTRLVNAKQADNEQLLDYIKGFKQLRDVAISHMGTNLSLLSTKTTTKSSRLMKIRRNTRESCLRPGWPIS